MSATFQHLGALAAETLLASGARTPERLRSIVHQYGVSYFGDSLRWSDFTHDLVIRAQADAYARIRPYQWSA